MSNKTQKDKPQDLPRRYLEIVEAVRERMRTAPEERYTLEAAAREAGLSPTRLHQVFESVQRESFGAYARRARLEFACGLMRAFPDWTVTRVAYEAGYSESSEFSRSFKRAYGIAPSRWNRVAPLNRTKAPKENAHREEACGVLDGDTLFPDHAPAHGSPVAIRTRPVEHMAVLAVRDAIEPDNLAAAFDELEAFLSARGQIRPGRQFAGLSYDSNLDTQPELIRFELAYPVDPDVEGGENVLIRIMPEVRVAVLPCRGGVKDFVVAWDYLLRRYLPDSAYGFGPGPHMEIYYNDPRRHGMAYWDMDCVIPIKTKEEEHHDG